MTGKPSNRGKTTATVTQRGEPRPADTRSSAPRDAVADAIGRSVRTERAAAGLSRKRLAVLAGVSERYLNDLENGSANASLGILSRVTTALGLDLAAFLRRPLATTGNDERLETKSAAGIAPRLLDPGLASILANMSPAEQQAAAALLVRHVESRRRSSRGLALLGLRGAGKSTLGRLFARRHGLPFISITREIETRAGMSLADLFNLGGPDAYRGIENEVARDLAARPDRIVLETAGGIVGNAEAMTTILAAFRTVWLTATPEDHLQRVIEQGDMRPMRDNPRALDHLKALLAVREPEYKRAECVLETSGKSLDACLVELEAMASPLATATA